MRKFWVGKRIIMSLFFVSIWMGAGESFARNKVDVSLSVRRHSERTQVSKKRKRFKKKGSNRKARISSENQHTTCILDISILNDSGKDVSCELEYYFISDKTDLPEGKPVLMTWRSPRPENRPDTVLDRGPSPNQPYKSVTSSKTRNISLGGGETEEETAEYLFIYSKSLTEEFTDDGDWKASTDYHGEQYQGYVVLLTVDGEIVAKESNSSVFLKDEWIEKCRSGFSGKPKTVNVWAGVKPWPLEKYLGKKGEWVKTTRGWTFSYEKDTADFNRMDTNGDGLLTEEERDADN